MDSSQTPQRGSMEDSSPEPVMEIVDVVAEQEAKRLANKQGAIAKAQEVRLSREIPEGREQDRSFWTADGNGVGVTAPVANAQKELPWHRIALYLKSKGYSHKEVAARVSKSEGAVGQLCRSPWFREQLEAVIEEEGRDSLHEVLNGEVLNSVYVLVDVRDNPESKGSDKIAAANSLIDRVLGKAPQTIQHVDGGRSEIAKQQDRLERELAEVDKALEDLGAAPSAKLGEADFAPKEAEFGNEPSLEVSDTTPLSSQQSVQQTTPNDL